jgi:hypothetical protein
MATASGITPLPKYKLVFLGVRVRAMRARRSERARDVVMIDDGCARG